MENKNEIMEEYEDIERIKEEHYRRTVEMNEMRQQMMENRMAAFEQMVERVEEELRNTPMSVRKIKRMICLYKSVVDNNQTIDSFIEGSNLMAKLWANSDYLKDMEEYHEMLKSRKTSFIKLIPDLFDRMDFAVGCFKLATAATAAYLCVSHLITPVF